MAKVEVYKETGEKSGSLQLPDEVFAVKPKEELVHQVLLAHDSRSRVNLAHTKTRSERRGGGAKPWRQKGTGRARAGSRRSPIWIGGGVIFGPRRERKFKKKVNTKVKRQALLMVLSDRVSNKKFIIVDKLSITKPKTGDLIKVLDKLPMGEKTTLVVLPGEKSDQAVKLSARNIPGVGVIRADSLNVRDLLSHEYVLLPKSSVELLQKTYAGKTAVKPKPKRKAPAKKKAATKAAAK